MQGDRRTDLINQYTITYEPHENRQGSHRIAAYDGRVRVLPDGATSTKDRRTLIRLRLATTYGNHGIDAAIRALQGLNLKMASPPTDQDRLLIRLQEGPFCGTELHLMHGYPQRIHELRKAGWQIESRPFCTVHNHRGNQARYRLVDGND